MKADIHPTYFPEAKIVCVCGHTLQTGSTMEQVDVELCANCHPFYTGKQKIVDTARRVEKFTERVGKTDRSVLLAKKAKVAKRAATKKAK
jgi:large subunit ribosomal protein L31